MENTSSEVFTEGRKVLRFHFNKQLPSKKTNHSNLSVVKIFKTIQGEGPYVGEPAIFIRLQGCNLQCPGCDTDYSVGNEMSVDEIIFHVLALAGTSIRLIVITGGEPFRQNISSLVRKLANEAFKIQIETNGTLYREDFPFGSATIVCSPKTPQIDERFYKHIAAWKYIVEAGNVGVDGLPTRVLGMDRLVARPKYGGPMKIRPDKIFIQPMDCQDPVANQANLHFVCGIAMQFGFRLSLQLHKIVGME